MLQFNDIFIKGTLTGLGATHYRISLDDITQEEWQVLPEDYTVEFSLPNAEGDYIVYFQLKNPYSISTVFQETFRYTLNPTSVVPTAPGNVSATIITETGFTIIWDASTDDIGIDHYDVLVNNVSRGTTTELTKTISGLTNQTSYNVIVRAYDADANYADSSTLTITTGQAAPVFAQSVKIVQVFSPTSIIDNLQTNIEVDHCFITLYNSANTSFNLTNVGLYWKNADQTNWIRTTLSGTIPAAKHFLIRGLSPTGIDPGEIILSDWTIAIPDLDFALDWTQAVGDKTTWALSQNTFFFASKSGSVLLTDQIIDPTTIPTNPTAAMTGYVDMVGAQADEFVSTAYETTAISGNSKHLMWNRKKVSNVYQDTNNNSANFESVNFGVLTEVSVLTAEIKSSRNG